MLFDLHTRRWNHDGRPGVFHWDRKRKFYSDLSRLLLDQDWLRFSWLEWKGQILACQYGFAYNGTYSHLQEGYDPACEHWSTGIGLRAWTIREFISHGIHEYDFLAGVGRHKTDWGADTKYGKQLQIARNTFHNRIFCFGSEYRNDTLERIKPLVPKKLLDWRHAQLVAAQRNGILNEPPLPAHSGRWLTKTAANCYYHLGFPKLVRPIRERYQLTRSSQGRSLRRRREPTARILYYHRVNNDNDRFFPAMSTTLFEERCGS